VWAFDVPAATILSPSSTAAGLTYVGVTVLTIAGAMGILVWRYRKLSTG
jgi:hypothetical protein